MSGQAISFGCTACGKCCNSAPQMTLAELFHHERRFIGALGLRCVPAFRAGDRIATGDGEHVFDDDDARAVRAHADAHLWRDAAARRFALHAQALSYPTAPCPALDPHGQCAIHGDRKPTMCHAVPLDPLVPERLQGVVLLRRARGEHYIGADCIRPGRHGDLPPLFDDGLIVDAGYAATFRRQLDESVIERRIWADAAFKHLLPELGGRVRDAGMLTLPLVPALLILADVSPNCRQRCMRYVDSQLALIAREIEAALERRLAGDKPVTAELRASERAYRALAAHWVARPYAIHGERHTERVEAYLGLI
ncbi:hypothetical protein ACDA63_11005 [Uliginosibacterium sp. sgz301328]|uniref:hypothetical protein n=1 Tax=Uliginosibacterium sp. sgz301328 TaxID=3243764 RepID=UPI00359E57BC